MKHDFLVPVISYRISFTAAFETHHPRIVLHENHRHFDFRKSIFSY